MHFTQIPFNGIQLSYQYATAGELGRVFPVVNGENAFDVVALIIKGTVSRTVVETGEKLQDRGAGWFSLENVSSFTAGVNCTVQTSYPTDSEILYFPIAGNEALVTNLTLIRLEAGDEVVLNPANNYFLAKGEIQYGTQTVTGPAAIVQDIADQVVKAVYDCYILNFAPAVK